MTAWIRTREELADLARVLEGCAALALDSESDSLHHHREKVCLVQIATDNGLAVLVDPLALRDLSPLHSVMANPVVMKVLHGADYDVTTLKRDFGFAFAGLFDTMIAARFLGLPEIGLQAVARAELGVELSKDSQKDDWSRRPLTPVQEAYALADVQHLLALHARLAAKLAAVGRLGWVREESASAAALPAARRGRDEEAWQRIKGVRKLPRRAQAVLRELVAWREARADSTDTPAFKILGTEPLLALAEKGPKTPAELREVRGLPKHLRDQPAEILAAVTRGLALPADELPVLTPAPPRTVLSDEAKRRGEGLKAWRALEAERARVDVSVVLPQRLIDRLAEAAPRDQAGLEAIAGLRHWRIEAFGRDLLAVLNPR
jgi:ribonuclease D